MATSSPHAPTSTGHASSEQRNMLFTVLISLAALAILLQGLWAGIFLQHDGERDAAQNWIDVHARGGEVALVLTVLATITAVVKLRHRRDLWIGAITLTVLLILESYLGGLIVDHSKDTLTAIHVPLGMAVMGVSVWLMTRAFHGRRASIGH